MSTIKTTLLVAAILAGAGMSASAAPRGGDCDMRPAFSDLDTNGDGSLTLAELQAAKSARFAQMDANGDGALSADELMRGQNTRRAERMISHMDQNGDGVLQIDELGRQDRPDAGAMFAAADQNGDGGLSEDEFKAAGDKMRDGRGDRGGRHGDHGPRGDCDGHGRRGSH